MTDMTLTEILFKLANFLPPDDAVAIVAQIERLMPADVSARIIEDMNTGVDLTMAALSHIEPQPPLFSVSPSAPDAKSASGKTAKAASVSAKSVSSKSASAKSVSSKSVKPTSAKASPISTNPISASLHHLMNNSDSTLGSKLDLLQQMYPARAAALYLRVLLNIVANLFEQKALHTLDDDLLNLLITGLLRSEAILDARCVDCPKAASS